jgi:2-polyprenyl-6-methoxyphenol hydroxylase-like FAD-dependent oxidoreductase
MASFDVVIVGARCAGASLALLLARSGHRVLLIDRAAFPSDTMSTLYIHQPGIRLLSRWGILPEIVASGTPLLDRVTYEVGGLRLHGPGPAAGAVRGGYAPRRRLLDQLLVEAAVSAGVEFRDRMEAAGLVRDGDWVTGVLLRGRGGDAPARVDAGLVVGADGMRSMVARLAGARVRMSRPPLSCVYYSVWDGLPGHFEFYEQPGVWVSVIPTSGGRTIVSTYRPQAQFARIRTDATYWHREAVRAASPSLHDRLAARSVVEPLRGTGRQHNVIREPWGPGWALVGDAGMHKDTITARGITDALLQADLLARCLGTDVHHRERLVMALTAFDRERSALLDDAYRSALALARLEITPDRLALLRVVSSSAELTTRFFAVVAGLGTMDDLLTPDVIAAL